MNISVPPDQLNGVQAPVTAKQLRDEAVRVGEILRSAIRELFEDLAKLDVRDQQSMQKRFRLSSPTTSRLVAGLRAPDALTMLARFPGMDGEGLRKVIKAAHKLGVPRPSVEKTEHAIDTVAEFIANRVGDRASFDALLAEWVSETRETFELRHRQSVFKGMSALRGVEARLVSEVGILCPSPDENRPHLVALRAMIGCRRIRPHASLRSLATRGSNASIELCGLDGIPLRNSDQMLMSELTTQDMGGIKIKFDDHGVEFEVHDLPIGTDARADILTGCYWKVLAAENRPENKQPVYALAADVQPPTEELVVDLLVHETLWPDRKAELYMLDAGPTKISEPVDPRQRMSWLETSEVVKVLDRNSDDGFALAGAPKHLEMIQYAMKKLGWNLQEFRGYRGRSKYPVYGSWVGIALAER